ncbi:MAG TPA: hypothetical protein VGJ86_17885, partial [Acidimicrobiales bacterium]
MLTRAMLESAPATHPAVLVSRLAWLADSRLPAPGQIDRTRIRRPLRTFGYRGEVARSRVNRPSLLSSG